MNDAAEVLALRLSLSEMADLAADMARESHARFKASEDQEVRSRAVGDFEICARSVRLSALCSVRLSQALREKIAEDAGRPRASDPSVGAQTGRVRDRDWEREQAGEREHDRDGHPLTALGRAEALEKALARNPRLDPDGRHTARIIDIKARLEGAPPPPPEPEPPAPASEHPPANRAERRRLERRMRRASG